MEDGNCRLCSFCISLVTLLNLHFPLDLSLSDSASPFNFNVEILWVIMLIH